MLLGARLVISDFVRFNVYFTFQFVYVSPWHIVIILMNIAIAMLTSAITTACEELEFCLDWS